MQRGDQSGFTKDTKVDMSGILIRTSNKFEAVYGKIVGGLTTYSL
jgi:hypothetical protein